MAYQKRNFQKEQLLTAADLNAMDAQIATNETTATSAKTTATAAQTTANEAKTLANGKAPLAHNQAASTITAGTLGGQVKANVSAAGAVGTAQVRDIFAGTADMTAGSSALSTGVLYLVYE